MKCVVGFTLDHLRILECLRIFLNVNSTIDFNYFMTK